MSYIRTPEIKKKISDALKEAHKNKPGAWRKDYKMAESTKKKLSKAHKGRKLTKEWVQNRTKSQRGLKRSEETRKKISEAKKGENSPLWRGGVSLKNRTERANIMSSFEYRNWRRSVFERDDFCCVLCNKRGGEIQADHIKPFAEYPHLRFDIDNGRTLCLDCHRSTDTWGMKSSFYKLKQELKV